MQVADVEAVGGRVAAVVERDRTLGEPGGEGVAVGGVVDQAAGLEVVEQVHEGDRLRLVPHPGTVLRRRMDG